MKRPLLIQSAITRDDSLKLDGNAVFSRLKTCDVLLLILTFLDMPSLYCLMLTSTIFYELIKKSKHFTLNQSISFEEAVTEGYLAIVKYLVAFWSLQSRKSLSEPFASDAVEAAARYGQLETLQFLGLKNFPISRKLFKSAALGNHKHVIKWLKQSGYQWNAKTCKILAHKGYFETLKWARKHECPWDGTLFEAAAYTGQLEIMKWALKNGCPGIESSCITHCAAVSGHLNVVEWALFNGSMWSEVSYVAAIRGGHIRIVKWAKRRGLAGFYNPMLCTTAAESGSLTQLKWLRRQGCPWDERTCAAASEGGHLDILQWLRSKHCPWDHNTCSDAARNGHVDVLKWAIDNKCPIKRENLIWEFAVKGGQIEVLKFLRERKYPWTNNSCSLAAVCNGIETLKWLRENGCPWGTFNCKIVRILCQNDRYDELLKWINSSEGGCPCCRGVHTFYK